MRSISLFGCRTIAALVLLFAIATATMPATGAATATADEFVPVYHPSLDVKRCAGSITVDANLDDPGWRGAAKADNFAEHSPGDQTQPEVDTEVLVTYDDDNLFVAWICHDDPDEVRATFCERDAIFSDDYVILCIDTFGDATLAYEISANPYGIPGDLLFSAAHGEDVTYDMIFESAGRITDDGWIVEMAVPFASMRFPEQANQVWRVDFWRNRPRESRYQYSWAAYERDEACWPCQWGTVNGISGVTPGKGFELLPYVVAHQSGELNDAGEFEAGDYSGDLGIGFTYDVSSEVTAEASVNPDFSQVESDAAQIDVNTTFALFYPERRPFFQEGSDLFDTYFSAVYTRSINDPIAAAKMTGRKGANSAAFLTARDDHSVIILPFAESSEFVENGKSTVNILRARHDLGDQSHLGVIATDRRFDDGGAGTLAGLDGRIRLSQSSQIEFQYAATYTEEVDNTNLTPDLDATFGDDAFTATLDGETFWGHGAYASFERNTRNFSLDIDYWQRSPTFRADCGFENQNDQRLSFVSSSYVFRFDNSRLVENMSVDGNTGRKWNFFGTRKDEWVNLSHTVQFRSAQSHIHSRYMRSNELFGGVQFDGIWLAHTCVNAHPGGWLQCGAHYDYGHRIARRDLVMGKEITTGCWATVKPIDRLSINSSFTYITSSDVDSGETLFSGYISRTRVGLQFSRELSARIVVQYNDFAERWEFDPLLRYRLNPLSTFYVGSTRDYRDLNLADHGREGWTLTDRQYFMKLQYLFQL